MGILPRNRASPKRTQFLLREDIRYLDEIIAQTRLLCNNRISDKEQLTAHQSKLEQVFVRALPLVFGHANINDRRANTILWTLSERSFSCDGGKRGEEGDQF